jgi:hypothetical protein
MWVRCWFDEYRPDELRRGTRVLALNGRIRPIENAPKITARCHGVVRRGRPPILTIGECNHRTQSHRTTQGMAMRSNRPRRLVKLGRHGMSEVPDHFDGAVAFGRKRGQGTITKLRRLHWNVKIQLRRFPRAMTWWRGPSYSIWTCRGTG